jgi:flagellar M-ring protein FliF
MSQSISAFGNQVKGVFKSMSAGKLISLTILVVATIWGLVVLARWSGQPEFMPLYTQLSAEDAGEVVGRLREQKVPYKISSDGTTIQIPRERIYEIRLDFAAQGLPRGGGVGFEVFDNTKLGMTDFVQNINYQRALQGELSRTINGLSEVESSRVHIVIPPRSLFVEEEEEATASVSLKVHHGKWLSNDQIQGVVHLLSSSVPRLKPQNVTIVDQNGKLLAGMKDQPAASKISSDQLAFQEKKERLLEKSVLTMLEQVLGQDRAIVRVSCELNFVQQEKTEEKYLPENQVVRSEQSSSEVSSKTASAPMGIPGMETNITRGDPAGGQTGNGSGFQKQDNTRNYEIGRVTSRQVMPVGELKQLSVAVVVDGKYETIVKGKGAKQREEIKYVPRTAEEMAKLENIVKRAVNFDEARGDQVEVANIPFSSAKVESLPETAGVSKWMDTIREHGGLIKYIMGGLFVLFTFLFVIRPLIRWLTDTPWEDVELLEHLPKTIAEMEKQYAQEEQNLSPMVSQAAQMIKNNQSDTTQLMQKWLKET